MIIDARELNALTRRATDLMSETADVPRVLRNRLGGQHPLVQQRLGDRPVRLCGQVRGGPRGVPVRAQQIGTQVRHGLAVVVAVEDLQHPKVNADGANSARFQDDSRAMIHPYRMRTF